MTFIKTTPASQASGAVREMYQRQEDHWGYVPNYAKLFSHRPEVLSRWGRLLAELRRPTDDRRFELVTFAAAQELKHSSCSLAHGKQLVQLIGEPAVLAITQGREADVLSEKEAAIVQFARAIARDASRITAGHVERLRTLHGMSDDEIFDIAAIAAGRCFLTKLLDALGSEPDAAFLAMEPRLRKALTVGRPICHNAPEYVGPPAKAS